MRISYKNSWDKIQAQFGKGKPDSPSYLKAQAALEIKTAIASANNTKKLIRATWVLALFTILLFISAFAYTIITYIAYEGSKAQIEALNALTDAVVELPKTEQRLKVMKEIRDKLNEEQKNARLICV